MGRKKTSRIAVAALSAAALLGGGIAAAAPASAATEIVDCPARPYWGNGIELWQNTGKNVCFADDGTGLQRAYTNLNGVQDVTSGLNYASIYILGQSRPWEIVPGQSLHLSNGGSTVLGVYIHA
ncbi:MULTISPECIES: hypothetical protein [Streptomyces]|uniref:hypothetical protein n=1 Tax=Streptomyces TaxID=1883 RepID=UPI001D994764|nr:hypothetical protein [Streptomyces sp. MAG02]